LGIRLGHPYTARIADAMQPHLFHDSRPPHVHVAALGDLGGAIGAALLVETHRDRAVASAPGESRRAASRAFTPGAGRSAPVPSPAAVASPSADAIRMRPDPLQAIGAVGNVSGAVPQPVLHLSSVLRSPLLDRAGERLGRVEDLIVRLA